MSNLGALWIRFYVFVTDRCEAPPLIANATTFVDADNRMMTANCIAGHRFPNGLSTRRFHCNDDGSWNDVESCKREYSFISQFDVLSLFHTTQCLVYATIWARRFVIVQHSKAREGASLCRRLVFTIIFISRLTAKDSLQCKLGSLNDVRLLKCILYMMQLSFAICLDIRVSAGCSNILSALGIVRSRQHQYRCRHLRYDCKSLVR